jgi:hypothetical protein
MPSASTRGLVGAVTRHPLAAVVLVGLVLRTGPWWAPHNFFGVLEYDDGVYYAAAKLLGHGLAPYRDFTIVHPPGLTVVLLPFAAVGELFGDPVGMACARVAMQLVAAANMVLIYRLAQHLRSGAGREMQGALLAAGLYAVLPNAVIAERTILLEPFVNLACLSGIYLLVRTPTPTRKAVLGCGLLLVAGISIKLFAGAYVLAALLWLVASRRARLLPALVGGLAAGTALFLAPFFAAAPSASWHDVVVTQLSRPTNTGVAQGLDRASSMVGLGWLPTVASLVVVVAVLTSAIATSLRDPGSPLTLWLTVAVSSGVAILWAPTYFLHYGAFLGPAVALLVGHVVATRAGASWGSRLRLAVAGATGVAFCIGSGSGLVHARGQVDPGQVAALIPRGSCVYYDAVSLALAADVYREPSPDCPSWVDGRGVALTQSTSWPAGVDFYPDGFVADSTWQAANVQQMQHAQYLLLRHDPATFPEWTPQTRQYAVVHFTRVWSGGTGSRSLELWKRAQPG